MNIFEYYKEEAEKRSIFILREMRKRLYELEKRELIPQTILLDIQSYDQVKAFAGYNRHLEIKQEFADLPLCGFEPKKLSEVRIYWNKDYVYFDPEAFNKADKLFGLPVVAVMTGKTLIQVSL